MDITLIAVGKCRDKPILSLVEMYLTRLKPYGKTAVVEVPQSPTSDKEAESLLAKVSADHLVIALDERGKRMTTRDFATYLQKQADTGKHKLAFLIGGADGHGDAVRTRADLLLSLSDMTFPHMMVRPIVLEQLYRAFSLNAGHPYHRD
ncbi:MAG: 23S rRNA (pseudouridine(1915)-N(3))-methyltransferase RlmH [Proteobacteria bacterium]|nr:23S rRNA (pseudouridine(1915)-N(3))-methyltransferase RlmH [Pseudomonadota bacterium]